MPHQATSVCLFALAILACLVQGNVVLGADDDAIPRELVLSVTDSKSCGTSCQRTVGCLAWHFCTKGQCGRQCDGDLSVSGDKQDTPACNALKSGSCALNLAKPTAGASSTQLQVYSKHAGWVSGHTGQTPRCKGLSAAVCSLCLGAKDPDACLLCASAHPPQDPLSTPPLAPLAPPTPQEQCGRCHASKDPAFCLACIDDDLPCRACVARSLDAPVDACLACSQDSYFLQPQCVDCAALPGPHAAQCFQCLDRARPNFCSPGSHDITGCISPDSNICVTCSTPGVDYARCTACAASAPFSEDCLYCPQLPAMAQQKACFTCAASGGIANGVGGCYDCLRSSASPDSCTACMQDTRVSPFARSWCNACTNWYRTPKDVLQCMHCLRGDHANYVRECGPGARSRRLVL